MGEGGGGGGHLTLSVSLCVCARRDVENGVEVVFALLCAYTPSPTGTKVIGGKSMEDMVSKLKKPRRVMMLVKAGSAVDAFIDKLVPLLEAGDIIIDGGNSEYTDSNVRNIHFVNTQKDACLYVVF